MASNKFRITDSNSVPFPLGCDCDELRIDEEHISLALVVPSLLGIVPPEW